MGILSWWYRVLISMTSVVNQLLNLSSREVSWREQWITITFVPASNPHVCSGQNQSFFGVSRFPNLIPPKFMPQAFPPFFFSSNLISHSFHPMLILSTNRKSRSTLNLLKTIVIISESTSKGWLSTAMV